MAAVLKGSGGEWWVLREKRGSHGDEEQDPLVPQLKRKYREEQTSKRVRNLSSDPQPFRNATSRRLCNPMLLVFFFNFSHLWKPLWGGSRMDVPPGPSLVPPNLYSFLETFQLPANKLECPQPLLLSEIWLILSCPTKYHAFFLPSSPTSFCQCYNTEFCLSFGEHKHN